MLPLDKTDADSPESSISKDRGNEFFKPGVGNAKNVTGNN
jgi:hypothetical protein